MRFEELAYRLDGLAVTVPFHRKLTVVNGFAGTTRRQWAERVLGALQGTPAGSGASLILVDGSGSRVRLVRDLRGGTSVTDLESGEDLAEQIAQGGPIDWLALLGLDPEAAAALMLLDPVTLQSGGDDEATEASAELIEAREVLAKVEVEYQEVFAGHRHLEELRERLAVLDDQIRNFDEELARRRHGQAVRAVQRLEAELALLNGAEPAERVAAEAAITAARAGEDWHRAAEALEQARAAFGERRRLDPRALERALALPTETPPALDALQSVYLSAAQRRAELVARLDEGAASELPAPSAPWMLSLARNDHPELWARAERVRAAKTRAAELSMGLGGTGQHRDMVQELEVAHRAVEEAERAVAGAKIPPLAMAAKRRVAKAQEREHAVLTKAGFVSWLAFQMRRIDVLLEPDALEALRVAELEAQLAASAWGELAGDVDAEAALAARAEVDRYAAELAAAEGSLDATEALRRQLTAEVEPAYAKARRALLEACQPFDVEPEHAASEVSAIVSEARHARLQHALEEAEAAYGDIKARLESLLPAAGLPGPGVRGVPGEHGDLAARVTEVTARAAEAAVHLEIPEATRPPEEVEAELSRARATLARLSRPDWDEHPVVSDTPLPDTQSLMEERSQVLTEAEQAARSLPDIGRLADRREALQRRVAILETSAGTGPKLLSCEEAEMVLLGRFAQARRVGPEAEPVPIVVDDALAGFPRHDKWRLLDLLARLGEASQVIYLTDDPDTLEWAGSRAAEGSAALLRPGAVASVA